MKIARCLAESKVERPSYYLAKKGIGNHQSDCDYNNPYMWRGNTVASILDRLEYTGCTVNFRTYKKSYKEKKSQKADKADWVIFEGTQEPIIDKETWNIVQGLRKNVRRADSLGEANPLTGKVICGECGSVMYNHRRKNGRIRVYYTPKGERRESFSKPEDCYSCSQNALGRQKYQKVCSCHAIRTSALRKIALECIRRTCAYVNNNQEEFLNLYNQISESQSRTRLEELKSRISKAERRAKEVSALIRKIYEDNIAGRLSDKMLESLLESYEKEKASLEKEEDECHKQLEQAESQSQNTEHFIKLAHKYTDFSELTPSMINEFISKIVVHFDTAISNLNQTAAPLRRQLKQNENRMRAIAQIKDAAAVHAKLKPVHDTFIKKNFKLTKDAYAAQHKDELDAFNKAVRTLMKLNGSTAVDFSALDAEFSALQSGSAELRTKLETLQPDISALKNIRKYIDMVLNKQQLSAPGGKTPEKESVLKKLEEAKAAQFQKKAEQKNHTQEL
mgnify:CR=1 FL=1